MITLKPIFDIVNLKRIKVYRKMSDPKKHHYVPQFYLNEFQIKENKTKNPKIFVYSKDNPQTEPMTCAIKDTACRNNYHTIEQDGIIDRVTIEKILSKQEALLAPQIKKIIEQKYIKEENIVYLAVFILLMKNRNPQNLEPIEKFFENIIENSTKLINEYNNTKLEYSIEENVNLKKCINSIKMQFLLKLLLDEQQINILFNMNYSLFETCKNKYFISSDCPVSYSNNSTFNRGIGLLHPDLEIFVPLNDKIGIFCSHNKTMSHKILKEEEVDILNKRTILWAKNQIYSSIKDNYINNLIEETIKKIN